MFIAETKNIHLLRDAVDVLSQIIDEGIFKFKKEGIEFISTDRAMVAVVDFKLASSAFEKYECDKETAIGLNTANFLTVLKRASGEDKVTLKLNEEENRLEISIAGKSARNFAIPLLDISSEEIPPIAQLEFPATAEVKTEIVEEGIADADIIADSVVIEVADTTFKMRAEGDSSKTELKIDKSSDSLININTRDAVRSRYPLDYLKKFMKAAKLVETAKLQLGNDFPMKLEFKGEGIYLAMVLAPRVEES